MQHERPLFLLQTELVDAKVEVSVSRAIAPVIEQIVNLRQEVQQQIGSLRDEMHQQIGALRKEMHHELSALRGEMHEMRQEFGACLSAVETELGMRREVNWKVRAHLIDYTFKTVWVVAVALLASAFSLMAIHLHFVH